MIFNEHSGIADQHAFLSASKSAWVNYDEEQLASRWQAAKAAAHGVKLHAYAKSAIELGLKQPRAKKTLNMYVNDAIGYKMSCEQPLFYSENAFGTADTISFRRGLLRIHDLKTGISPATFRQLDVYAALFSLEYGVDPFEIQMEFRIYQSNEVFVEPGNPKYISSIMEKIEEFDLRIEAMKEREGRL